MDKEMMHIVFSSLIINVRSINKKFGRLKQFMDEFNLAGQTNGKLLIVSEMVSPLYELVNIVEKQFKPLGFIKDRDFIFMNVQSIRGSGNAFPPTIDKTHPDCVGILWLGSLITAQGNFVWYRKPFGNDPRELFSSIKGYNTPQEENTFKRNNRSGGVIDTLRSHKKFSDDSISKPKKTKDYKEEYLEKLSEVDDMGLIKKFNSIAERRNISYAEMQYQFAIHYEFERRKLDYSEIGNPKSLSFARKVKLVGNKVVIK